MALTFDEFSRLNLQRCNRWHENMEPWSLADWSNAMQGEAGEAGNIVKKIRRLETGWPQSQTREELIEMLADEIADTFAYLDLLASMAEIDIAACIVSKFNRVSDREGMLEKFPEYWMH